MSRAKINNDVATRCELALMGKVVPCTTEEVFEMTKYILSAIGKDPEELSLNFVEESIQKYHKNEVKYLVCNTVMGMKCITYLLDSGIEDEEDEDYYPAPFVEDYGTGYPCAFCYVFNTECDWCSEFGDSFFQKRADGFYHRVS